MIHANMEVEKVENFLKSLELCGSAELPSIVNSARKDDRLIRSIIRNFDEHISSEVCDDMYLCLFELYRSGEQVARQFVLQFVPIMMWNYLLAVCTRNQKDIGKIEAILLAIYNMEIVDVKGNLKNKTFRVPSLSRPSIYHEPSQGRLTSSVLTESALSRHEQLEVPVTSPGPGQQLNKILAVNRLGVMCVIMAQYNANIALLSRSSHSNLCHIADRIARSGFKQLCSKPLPGVHQDNAHHETLSSEQLHKLADLPRIALSADFIIQLVQGLYYCMYNGFPQESIQAIDHLHFRAAHSMLTQAYMQTNAIKHLLSSTGGIPQDGTLGLRVVPTHSATDKDSNKYQEVKTGFRQLEKKKVGSALKPRSSSSLDDSSISLPSPSRLSLWRRSFSYDSSARASSSTRGQVSSQSVDNIREINASLVPDRLQSLLLQVAVGERPEEEDCASSSSSITFTETQL